MASFELDRQPKLGLGHPSEAVARIELASGTEKEFRKGCGRCYAQRVDGLGHRYGRRELLGSRHYHQGTELGVGCRKVARQVMEDDADIGVAARYSLKHIAVLDAEPARKCHRLPGEDRFRGL